MNSDALFAEIKHALTGLRGSLHMTYAFGLGTGVQVKDGTRKVGPIIFPNEGETVSDVLRLLAALIEDPS